MSNQKKQIKKLPDSLKKNKILEDKISTLISDLYQEKHLETEREKKVLFDRFFLSTKGKGVVLENRAK